MPRITGNCPSWCRIFGTIYLERFHQRLTYNYQKLLRHCLMVAIANSFMRVCSGTKTVKQGFTVVFGSFSMISPAVIQPVETLFDLLRIVYEYTIKMNPVHKGDLVNLT